MESFNVTNNELIAFLTSSENVLPFYDGDHLSEGVYIVNKEITISDTGSHLSFDESLRIDKGVHFINCIFNSTIGFGGSIFNGQFVFEDCIFNKFFCIGMSIFRRDGSDNKGIETYFKYLYFDKCKFNRDFSILSGIIDNITFDECEFKNQEYNLFGNDIYIQGGRFNGVFTFLGGIMHRNIEINGGHFEKGIFFGNKIEVKSRIAINYGYISSINMYDVSINELFINELYRNYLPELNIDKSIKKLKIGSKKYNRTKNKIIIKNIKFNYSPDYVSINKNCIIQECNFKEYDSSSNSAISFYGTTIERIEFEYFNNYGKINFINIQSRKKSSQIICNYANLGTVDFVSCDLSKFSIYIDNTKLIGIFYTSTIFPKSILTRKKKKDEAAYQQLKDTYDQLQTVANKQGDRVMSLDWQKKSLDNYRNSLKFLNSKYTILSIMYISNNYRTRSSLGVLFTLILSLITFSLYLIFYTGKDFIEVFSIDTANAYSQYFFEFLNPTHKSDFIGNLPAYPIAASATDFLGRIIIGFGFYQIIQAFRRYGRE